MSWPTFLFWNALGGIAWATSIGLLAYFVGHSAEKFIHLAGLGGAVVVVLAGVALWFVLRAAPAPGRGAGRGRDRGQIEAEARGRGALERPRARAERGPAGSVAVGGARLRGLVALDRRRAVADLDGHPARLALLGLGDADLEDAACRSSR